MKCLDTPLLVGLLRGRPEADRWLRDVGGDELATTEVNLYELEGLARSPSRGSRSRVQALHEVRREISVLEVNPESVRQAGRCGGRGGPRQGEKGRSASSWDQALVPLVLGTAIAHGAREFWTDTHRWLPGRVPGLQVRRVGRTGRV
jgi:predicted nucleic acid-binding protein